MKYLLLVALAVAGLAFYFLRPGAKPPLPTPPAAAHPSNPVSLAGRPVPPDSHASVASPRSSAPDPSSRLIEEFHHLLRPGVPLDRDRLVNALLPTLVARDPATAARLVEELEAGPVREELLRHLARLMSASDIHTTLAWLSRLPPTDQPMAAEAVMAQINQSDPAGALEVADVFRIGLDDGRQEHLLQLWTESDPVHAMAWVTTRPAGPARDRLLARAAHVRVQQDPAQAVQLVLNHMAAGPAQEEALMGVIRQWAVRDPAAAADWVKRFSPGPLLTRAQAELEIARKVR
jgi:hypothetical protein